MYDQKLIGAANYLQKSDQLFIPFKIRIDGADCTKIKPMID